jgi:hypothetical protein
MSAIASLEAMCRHRALPGTAWTSRSAPTRDTPRTVTDMRRHRRDPERSDHRPAVAADQLRSDKEQQRSTNCSRSAAAASRRPALEQHGADALLGQAASTARSESTPRRPGSVQIETPRRRKIVSLRPRPHGGDEERTCRRFLVSTRAPSGTASGRR